MSFVRKAKNMAFSLPYYSGFISWLLREQCYSKFVILTYHRVISPKEENKFIQAGMYVEPATFEMHMKVLNRYFNIVPFAELVEHGERISRNKSKPLCVLTFDDGWYDFYKYAFPVLKFYQIPATVFLPTDFIGTNRWLWSDRLAFVFSQMEIENNTSKIRQHNCSSIIKQILAIKGNLELKIETAIAILKEYQDAEINEIISELSVMYNLKQELSGRSFLSWKEVKDMERSGIINYGSHTAKHRILTNLTNDQIQEELYRSRNKLLNENIAMSNFMPFCYPNGNYNDSIAEIIKNSNFDVAVTTNRGWNSFSSNPFTLRRISIHQDMASKEASLGCRISGIL